MRLIRDGRYDVARALCELACQGDAPAALKDHFGARLTRIDRIGKPAPPIAATDVDGKPAALAELKRKVVLIDFWATWCPPSLAEIPTLKALDHKYRDQGLVIMGINVDAMHHDSKEQGSVLPKVRRFLVDHRITWTNVLSGQGALDLAASYGVEQIPANFLVGRDGNIVALEQSGDSLELRDRERPGQPTERPIPLTRQSRRSHDDTATFA